MDEKINAFALQYFDLYRRADTKPEDLMINFADTFHALGFKPSSRMACGIPIGPWVKTEGDLIDEFLASGLDYPQAVGDEIFTRWIHLTNWKTPEKLLSPENRAWFLSAFRALHALSSEETSCLKRVQGEGYSLRLTTVPLYYPDQPLPGEALEQEIYFSSSGDASITLNRAERNGEDTVEYQNGFIDPEGAQVLIDFFIQYFQNYVDHDASKSGYWEMVITDTEGVPVCFSGPVGEDFEYDGCSLSDMMRSIYDHPDLLIFDAPQYELLSLNLHVRGGSEETEPDENRHNFKKEGERSLYEETLTISKADGEANLSREADHGSILNEYVRNSEDIESLLDELAYPAFLLEEPVSSGCSGDSASYELDLVFKRRGRIHFEGNLTREGIPKGFEAFLHPISQFFKAFSHFTILEHWN